MEIKRALQGIVEESLVPQKVNLIFGTRRVGKTYLLEKIIAKNQYKVMVLQGEDDLSKQFLENRSIAHYERIFQGIELLVIDEAQAIPEIGKVLKLIVDHIKSMRILVTGSSAFDLANLSGEPLTGRAYFHQLYPIAQQELSPQENAIQTLQNLEDRMVFGSYPEVVNQPIVENRINYLRELLTTYLLKDLMMFEGIRNSNKIMDLLRLIAYQVGKEVSLQELGSQLGISKNTVEKYLDLFSKVFILVKIGGYSRNLRKEITKNARWYFLDNGIRNALINDFRPLILRKDVGELWENYLIAERIKLKHYEKKHTDFYFWRTYDQQEIDWIEFENGQLSAYEFKWKKQQVKIPKAFENAYPESTFEVINQENYLPFITSL